MSLTPFSSLRSSSSHDKWFPWECLLSSSRRRKLGNKAEGKRKRGRRKPKRSFWRRRKRKEDANGVRTSTEGVYSGLAFQESPTNSLKKRKSYGWNFFKQYIAPHFTEDVLSGQAVVQCGVVHCMNSKNGHGRGISPTTIPYSPRLHRLIWLDRFPPLSLPPRGKK